MADDKPSHTDRDDRDEPSRFPTLFPSLHAEEWAASGLEHWVEDNLILGGPPDHVRDELESGIRHQGVRYVQLLGVHTGSPYNEWLIEAIDDPYWRVVFRTNIEDDWPPTRIVSIVASEHAKEFLLSRGETLRG